MRQFLRSSLAAFIGIGAGLFLCWLAGESPLNVFLILVKSSVGSPYDLGMTLFYSTPLIFTGLSVAVAYRAGLFNVGAEGQLNIGSLLGAIFGIYFGELSASLQESLAWIAPLLGVLICFMGGAFWGLIVGW